LGRDFSNEPESYWGGMQRTENNMCQRVCNLFYYDPCFCINSFLSVFYLVWSYYGYNLHKKISSDDPCRASDKNDTMINIGSYMSIGMLLFIVGALIIFLALLII